MESEGRKYYEVRVGKVPGIYRSWEEAHELVTGFPGAKHKSFRTYQEAVDYMNCGGRRNGPCAGGAHTMAGGSTIDSVAAGLNRFRLSSSAGGGEGSSRACLMAGEDAEVGVLGGTEAGHVKDVCADCQRSSERLLGFVCRSLGLGLPVFVPQQSQPTGGKESFGFTFIMPKSDSGLEVVAYGPTAWDEGSTRKEAAHIMTHRVLTATAEKLRMLEVECGELKKLLICVEC
ncbi:hypothetical protein PIB30_015679 [Stylosanthes scabra]|uniref:Ribonuclease H1 N-terminal domain-containing protein n=1 Tax=Stylosanthes scabra TaxID=79078 RepID=A0ABU6U7G0_9FABA|nr:hypothetical protein [Stylosanthes scabra]